MTSEQRWWTVRRTWHVQAESAMDALEAARPGEHADVHVLESELQTSPEGLTQLLDGPNDQHHA